MTENEKEIKVAIEHLKARNMSAKHIDIAIQALEEIQQYREYKEIFKSHFTKEALELLRDKEEFCKWLERGKWIAKKCDEINRKLECFESIGTIEEFKALKEKNVAKKVIVKGVMGFDGEEAYCCPTCGLDNAQWGCNRCVDCGQKLDWQ